MILTRPLTTVVSGTNYTYTSDLVLRGTSASFARHAIINEFSQGPRGGTSEWVEILTLSAGNLRQWKFDDATADNFVVNFADSLVWDNVPAGTLIIIYNGSSKDPILPADDLDFADGRLVIASNNSTYFTGSWPSLSNNGDGLVTKDSTGASVHALSYGDNSTFSPFIGTVDSNTAASFTGDSETVAATASGWRTNSSSTAGSQTSPESPPAREYRRQHHLRRRPPLRRLQSTRLLPDCFRHHPARRTLARRGHRPAQRTRHRRSRHLPHRHRAL